MAVVALAAGLFALFRWAQGFFLVAICALYAIAVALLWKTFRGYRRLAGLGFVALAILANVGCAVAGIYFAGWDLILVFLGWFFAFPLILGFGGLGLFGDSQEVAASSFPAFGLATCLRFGRAAPLGV